MQAYLEGRGAFQQWYLRINMLRIIIQLSNAANVTDAEVNQNMMQTFQCQNLKR